MQFSNIQETEEGGLRYDVKSSREEAAFLIDFAVNRLIAEGLISISADGETEQNVELKDTRYCN